MRILSDGIQSWRPNRRLLLVVALMLQAALVLKAFGPLLLEPGKYLLCNVYDGAKNYYTFQAYVQQPWENGLGWFGMMNYPYGDYLFYTDNTPLLAVPVRLWSHYISDLRPYALDVYHWLLLSGFLLSTGLLVAILRRLVRHWGLVLVFAVTLPWLNPQVSRLPVGHFNLSYSFVLLFAIWGLLNLYERVQAKRPLLGWMAVLTVGFTLFSFLHLYYLLLLAVLTGGFFAWWLLPRHRWLSNPKLTAAATIITVGPAAMCMLLIRLIDGYYTLRKQNTGTFDYEPWKLQVSALFRAPNYNVIDFWFQARDEPTYESFAYLGAFVLFGGTLLAGWALLRPASRQRAWRAWQRSAALPFLYLLLGASIISLLISVGTTYQLDGGNYVIINYLNLFFYLKKFTDIVTQFRVIARFSWVFFWAVNLLCVVGLDFWLLKSRGAVRWVLTLGLLILVVIDTRDALKHFTNPRPNLLTNQKLTSEVNKLLWAVQPERYQAILPVPYFHIGSEVQDLTMDDYDGHSMHTYQLALRTNLPMLASKMSRTPPEHLVELRSLFAPEGPTPALRARLRAAGKPLLVFFDKSYYDGTDRVIEQVDRAPARETLDAGGLLPDRQHLTLLSRAGSLYLYRWDL